MQREKEHTPTADNTRPAPLSPSASLRTALRGCLDAPDPDAALAGLERQARLKQFIRPLFSLLRAPETRQRAAEAIGWLAARLAEEDTEAARDIVRRLMLGLTEESGGIGWGSPEAIGAVLARNAELAGEYASILISYLEINGDNYLEHPPLQCGVLWGIARLAESGPGFIDAKKAAACLRPHLESPDEAVRSLAAQTIALFDDATDTGSA